jgi:ACS family hexuronate transporter-like MFS transporter
MKIAPRWVAFSVFILATALNYLDRSILSAVAPAVREEFGISNQQFGWLLSTFNLFYALTAPAAGLFIDRIGLNRGAAVAVGLWSAVGIVTGLVRGFTPLLACRAGLGVTAAGAIPASGKANALYLRPQERSLGTAANQIGISTGLVTAPVLAGWLAEIYGWRSAFIVTGALGFIWIPLWLQTARRVPPVTLRKPEHKQVQIAGMLRDRAFWGLVAATMLAMSVYSLWTQWTTIYFVTEHGMSQTEANLQFAWMPPVFGALGGLVGGWLALRGAQSGLNVQSARLRTCLLGALMLLTTAAIPFLREVRLATAVVCLSLFCGLIVSVNLYAIPLDIFGPDRAAFSISALTLAYGAMAAVQSPLVGWAVDNYGFKPVCLAVAGLPLAAVGVLRLTLPRS